MQENLAYLQKREAHMQYPTYQQAGWPIGSGSVESANKLVVEARLKGAGMRWERQNVNPLLVLRNAVCNRQWHETWATSVAHRRALRTSHRQAESQQHLTSAFWFLVFWGVRVSRLSHPPVPTATSTMLAASAEQPAHRPGSGYSWRKPFLRRPPSTPAGLEEVGAKKPAERQTCLDTRCMLRWKSWPFCSRSKNNGETNLSTRSEAHHHPDAASEDL
jgi:hypothetical protein